MTKPFHAGHAAETGTLAADLAALGWTAAADILEAPRGFFQAAGGGFDPGAICNGMPVEGATVATTPPGTVRYFANATPSPTSIAPDATTGSALIANIPLSNTTISAAVNGITLRSHAFDGVAGALMQIEFQP